MNRKVTVVGSGHVGATLTQRIIDLELADVCMIDILEGVPQGKGLDMAQAAPVVGSDARSVGTNDYKETANSEIVVITAGFPRKPGMSRDDLLLANADIVRDVTRKVMQHSRDPIIIVVTNPLDAMCHVALEESKLKPERVMGMAGILDSARFRSFIAMELGVSVENTHAFVLGGHGDTMVPLPRFSTVVGIPITELMDKATIERLVKRTRNGGAEIVSLLKTGSAYYAPSAAVVEMIDAILKDKKKILPCAAYLRGEYGIKDLFVGVPVKLGAAGVEQIIEVKLLEDEKAAITKSAGAVRELVEVMKSRAGA